MKTINDLLDGYYILYALNNSDFFEKGILNQIDYLSEGQKGIYSLKGGYISCIGDCVISDYSDNNLFENKTYAKEVGLEVQKQAKELKKNYNTFPLLGEFSIRHNKIKNRKEFGKEGY